MDGIRGLLAVCVAVYHTFWFSNINSTTFFNQGAVIIDLFFVFSGFLMFTLYGHRLNTPVDARKFLKRRFARLYPIHFFMVMVFLAYALARLLAHHLGLTTAGPGDALPFQPGSTENWYTLFANLTLTHSVGVTDSLTFNPPSWTISVEMFAYSAFLLMFMYAPPKKLLHYVFVCMGVAAIYFGLSRVKPDLNINYDLGFWRCLAGFYVGVTTAWAYQQIRDKEAVVKIVSNRALITSIEVATMSAFVAFVIYMPGKLQFFVAPFAFIFVLTMAFDAGWVSRIFSNRVFLYLAKISYSVYMTHAIFAFVLNIILVRIFPNVHSPEIGWFGDFLLVPYLAMVIIFSHLTWKYIEIPGKVLLQKVSFYELWQKHRPKLA